MGIRGGGVLKKWRKASVKGSFLNRVFTLAGGTAVAQAVTILSMPILTRLYLPEDLGEYGLFLAFLRVTTVPASLVYEPAVVEAEDDREAAYVIALSLLLAVCMTPLTALLFYALVNFNLLGFGALSAWCVPLVIGTFLLMAIFSVLRYWFIRTNAFGVLSQVSVIQNVVKSVGQIGLAFSPLQFLGLFLGELAGKSMGMQHIARISRREILPQLRGFCWLELKIVAHKFRSYPLYSLPSSFINILAINLTLPMLVFLHGNSVGGYFLIAQRVLNLPLGLIGSSVSDVFYAQMSDYVKHQPDRVKPFFLTATRRLAGISALIVSSICVAALLLFERVFGSTWVSATPILLVMAPWAFCTLVVSSLSRLIFLLGQQRNKLIYDVAALSTQLLAILAASFFKLDVLMTLGLISAGFVISYSIYFLIIFMSVKRFSPNNS